ncbi:MAG: DNA repair protein RecN [Simkaniaceae bacterium]
MLVSLTLRNFVLIDQITLPFHEGFHVLTGETGAGKTLLVQAMHLLTGQKVSVDLIRHGEDKATIEALFDIGKLPAVQIFLQEAGIEQDPQEYLHIKRELTRASKNRIFINSQLASLALLSKIGPLLLSLIGQNSAQHLRHREEQRALIDTFGDLDQEVLAFSLSYEEEKKLEDELAHLERKTPEITLEKLRFEWEEWNRFQYQEGEEETLFDTYKTLAQHSDSLEKLSRVQEGLDHPSLLSTLLQCQKLSEGEISEHLGSAIAHLQEASYLTSQKLENSESQAERFEEVEERLSTLNSLKKKYRIEVSEILTHVESLQREIDTLENLDLHISSLKKKLKEKQQHNNARAATITEKRKASADILCSALTRELQALNMPHAKVVISIEPKAIGPTGGDQVTLFLAANKGEVPASLESKTSGGELSRFLFAVTLLLSEKNALPTLIFDEIDSNVGGETATLVGQKLKALGKHCQVLAISHFPQVARFADHHMQISKTEKEGRTVTTMCYLEKNETDEELMRMLGGTRVHSPK